MAEGSAGISHHPLAGSLHFLWVQLAQASERLLLLLQTCCGARGQLHEHFPALLFSFCRAVAPADQAFPQAGLQPWKLSLSAHTKLIKSHVVRKQKKLLFP